MQTINQPKRTHGTFKHWVITELEGHYRGYTTVAPDGCDLTVGQKVLYTNENGAYCELIVKGFTANNLACPDRTVYVFDDCWWFPAKANQLKPI